MCAIYGAFSTQPRPLAALAKRMGGALIHRGPDDAGYFENGRVLLGNQRLSIIDIAGGHQPMLSDDGQIVVVQNGEIYNYVELQEHLRTLGNLCRTQSDTEVLLRLYECYGASFVHHLNGMFAIAIYDARSDEIHLFRDRLGQKPLFIAQHDGTVLFASEIKALLAAGIQPKLAPEALHHMLSFNYVPPHLTMFEGVGTVLPGHHATINAHGMVHSERWWQPNFATDQRSDEDWVDATRSTLQEAVARHMRSDVEVGAFLSGGVDSSAIVALAANCTEKPMHSFSMGFDDARFDETRYAHMVAERYGTNHHVLRATSLQIDLWPKAIFYCDQPHGDASFIPTHMLSCEASRQVKVVLTGDGGDELFAGYERFTPFFENADTQNAHLFGQAYFSSQQLLSHSEKLALYSDSMRANMVGNHSFDLWHNILAETAALDPINRALWIDMQWLLPGNNLVKPDRMGMATSLEARVPFLDHAMIDLALSMPGHLKWRSGETKYVLKKAMEPLLPHELLYRPKQMFTVPIGEWFKGPLAGTLRRMLTANRTMDRGLFSLQRVSQLCDEHIASEKNHTRILRALMAIELWHRVFIDGEPYAHVPEYFAA